MTYKITFSSRADETYDLMRDQIFFRWGKRHVLNFEKRTLKVLEILAEEPFVYQSTEEDSNIRKAHIHKNCSLFYRIANKEIFVSYFWDNRQDPLLK